ncbi:hypothetical protein Ancab_035048 [Ancistrocladus abbreviatus]
MTDRGVTTGGGSCSSATPYSDCNLKSSKQIASLEFPSCNKKTPLSTVPVSNDDGHSSPIGFKPTHINATAGHFSGKSSAAADSIRGYVSPSTMQAADALMEDETTHIMRRENLKIASSKSPQKNSVVSQPNPSTPTSGVKTRPNPPRPIKASDQCHYSSPGLGSRKPNSGNFNSTCREGCKPTKAHKANKISNQPGGIKFSHKTKGPRIKQNDEPLATAVKNDCQLEAAALYFWGVAAGFFSGLATQ